MTTYGYLRQIAASVARALPLIMLAWVELVFAAKLPCAPVMAEVVSAQGSVEMRRGGDPQWQPADLGDVLCAGDQIRVKERSRAALALTNDSVLRLDERTTMTLISDEANQPSLLELCRGAIYFFTRYRKTLRVITPFVNAGVEGTELSIGHTASQDHISVYEGQVKVSSEPERLLPETCDDLPEPAPGGGSLILTSGESGLFPVNQTPSKVPGVLVRPEDAVQWALYYPAIIDYGAGEETSATEVRESIELYGQGRLAEAISRLNDAPARLRGSRFLIYRAGLLLLVGRVDEAILDIEQALKLEPSNSNAYALQAIIAVVQNQKDEALALAGKALELDPKSSAARIALSYTRQARFQINLALASAEQAVALDPNNALAWARVAELEMSSGKLDRALAAAERAAGLNPNLARTHTILGFAHLTRINTGAAKMSFTRAIELDQADPLPRLGLGLARIRESNLAEGRREIEIATSLNPADSLIRSYLGKAYFEEKREALAGTQFDVAKALDPRDPTPWFYDAIRKQTSNRPVEALQDLEQSMELNDNRAVYRSRLLLDEDFATRGASLAPIYDDLGFDQLALVEASKSLSLDPANYSAHRFLSDTYARLPRHEIARVSEILQAQLLQPINVNPVQPRFAVTNLNVVTGDEAAFNEFTPLFERTRPQVLVTGVAGSNGTFGNEAVLSGLLRRFSYSLGQFHYETDGFRSNNDIKQDIYNVFAQVELTPNLNVQTEFRTASTEHGDLQLNFDAPDLTDFRRQVNQDTMRLGAHVSASTQSDLVASLIYSDRKDKQEFVFRPDIDVDEAAEDQGYQFEGQYVFRAGRTNFTAGGSHFDFDQDVALSLRFLSFAVPPDVADFKSERSNAYLYSNINYPRNLIWAMGMSYDSYKQGNFEFNKLNPKLGLQWEINRDVGIRLAWFETVKPALLVNQMLEPTQVAGFNQIFDDPSGTKARRRGIGIDVHLSKTLYGGAETSRRDLEVPLFSVFELTPIFFEDRQERLDRAYLYWTPYRKWAISAEYQLEKFRRDLQRFFDLPARIETTSVPLTLRYFDSSGLFAVLGPTYIQQKVASSRFGPGGNSDFVLLDAAIGYRLANRRGILTLEAKNLLDKKFRFQDLSVFAGGDPTQGVFRDVESRRYSIIPDRRVLLRFTLNF